MYQPSCTSCVSFWYNATQFPRNRYLSFGTPEIHGMPTYEPHKRQLMWDRIPKSFTSAFMLSAVPAFKVAYPKTCTCAPTARRNVHLITPKMTES